MNKTKIEWALNPDGTPGYTWNPITGCFNGCKYCYAWKLANGRLKPLYLANMNRAYRDDKLPSQVFDPFYPRFWEDRMWLHELVGTKRKPKGIFVCDMSDLFGIGIPEDWTRRVLAVISKHPRHRFYLLTKQPQNLIKFSPFPKNCWVGVSVTHRYDVLSATAHLGKIEAKVKYISFEPLLDDVSQCMYFRTLIRRNLDWVIIGSQTKPYKPPKIEWAGEIVGACDKAGLPVFLKDNLKPLIDSPVNEAYSLFVNDNQELRQEMPK